MASDAHFDVIAFDADDTLWHTEVLYHAARDQLVEVLADYVDATTLAERLDETEIGNLPLYGYGAKSFLLSMVETVIEVTEGKIRGGDIARVIEIGRQMLTAEVRLLDNVEATLVALQPDYPLMVITKGDASEQVPKLTRSGLTGYFTYIEVVGTKTEATYARILSQYSFAPDRFLMVGNSLRSDILPVLALGGVGVYVPSEIIWSHEVVDNPPTGHPRYHELDRIADLPGLIGQLSGTSPPDPIP
jgi:putative hydrolase of the HAD superfamily